MTKQVSAEAEIATALRWLDEFVEEPEYFPGAGDRQWWQERRQSIRVLAKKLDKSRATLPSAGGALFEVGQLISFQHGPDPTNIFTFRVVELGEDGKPSKTEWIWRKPSPPPPQPAAEGGDWRDKALAFTNKANLCTHAGIQNLAEPLFKELASSQARIEALEREHRDSKAAELEKMDGLCDLWHSNFVEVSEKLVKAEAREADLTAARELDLEAMRTALDYLVMPVDTEARIAKEKIQERLAARIKPASALTATKEEGR